MIWWMAALSFLPETHFHIFLGSIFNLQKLLNSHSYAHRKNTHSERERERERFEFLEGISQRKEHDFCCLLLVMD